MKTRFGNVTRSGCGQKTQSKGRPLLAFMTDDVRTPDPARALRRLTPGTIVIFRHYDAPDRTVLGRRLAALARRRRLIFIVAGDRRLAKSLNADGLHLPEGMVARRYRFAPASDQWLITAAAHDPASARRAARNGADIVLMSPVLPTASHPGAPSLGIHRLATVCRGLNAPVMALGGIGPASARRVLAAGAIGIAGIGGLPHLCRDPFGIRTRSSVPLAVGGDLV